jgi:hypothetical protein
MPKARPEKRRGQKADEQLPLPNPKSTPAPTATRVLPMNLRRGDVLVDERGERRIISGPRTMTAGKDVEVRVELVAQSGVTEVRSWGAHERVAVKREEPGK